jgi:hypothetical protein
MAIRVTAAKHKVRMEISLKDILIWIRSGRMYPANNNAETRASN